MSLVVATNNTWKYWTELPAVDNTMTDVNHFIGLICSRLPEVWDIYEFRNIRS
jgi:hypothetical protein